MSLEEQQEELIKLHLNPSNFLDENAVAKAAFLFTWFEDDFVKRVNKETFYLLPYKDISIYVYECDLDSIPSNTINGFATTVKDFFIKNNMCVDAEHMVKCYEKFIDHILLAFAQKNFMLKVSLSALATAKKSEFIAKKADRLATKAGDLATKADGLAAKAEQLANEADAQAKSTIANYISILGIFASIIFTLFGGVNLIGSTVKLLEVNSRWPYLTFIIALLMICLLTLLNMMVKWINSMSNLKNSLENNNKLNYVNVAKKKWYKPIFWDFYTKSVSCFLIILIISLVGMYMVNKENLFSMTTETTTTKPLVVEESSNKAVTKPKPDSVNKEITVVEKFTLSNHLNERSSDKE